MSSHEQAEANTAQAYKRLADAAEYGSMSGYITFNVNNERVRVRSDGNGLYHVETGWSSLGTMKQSGWVDYDTANRFIYENTK